MELPTVSICTPTFNRRPFFPMLIECFKKQTYPREKMEWIIVDDGTDKIEDLILSERDINIQYFKYETKMRLGEKRNILNGLSKGDIIVYMDDDDYYPSERVSHAVKMLQENPWAQCAGSSEMYIFFKSLNKMYQCGPYGPFHATAATFAFNRELLKHTQFHSDQSIAEERHFLKDYTVPMVQLDPLKTILVFSHSHNSFNKNSLLETPNKYIKESNKTVDDFIKEDVPRQMKSFFLKEIDELLSKYEPGLPQYKPDILEEIEKIKEERITMKLMKENEELRSKNKYLEIKVSQLISMVIELKKKLI